MIGYVHVYINKYKILRHVPMLTFFGPSRAHRPSSTLFLSTMFNQYRQTRAVSILHHPNTHYRILTFLYSLNLLLSKRSTRLTCCFTQRSLRRGVRRVTKVLSKVSMISLIILIIRLHIMKLASL